MNRPPEGTKLSEVALQVFEVLRKYTGFPWPVLAAQCKRVGATPETLTVAVLPTLIPYLAAGVGRFTSPDKEAAVRKELLLLLLLLKER